TSLECVCYPLLLLRACSSAPPSNFKLRKVSCFIKLGLSPRKHIFLVLFLDVVKILKSSTFHIPHLRSKHAMVLSAHSSPHCPGHQPFLGD
ncbi:hypothetical protein C8J57DRAFT_1372776, partial [Mycena rebaudengoi]